MKSIKELTYKIYNDISFVEEAESLDLEQLCIGTKISKNSFYDLSKGSEPSKEICEKFYSFAYSLGYRINSVKEEFIKENYDMILFHGSKKGLQQIDSDGSRYNCDFGKGFYLGESFENALSFICDFENPSVYSFKIDLSDLKILRFKCNLEWMLAICFYRGQLDEYKNNPLIKKIISKVDSADIIIAPIADNRMFYIMSLFINGDINDQIAIHSLSASQLGMQYVIKSNKALDKIIPIEKYYLCEQEKSDCRKRLDERSFYIDTKIKMSKRKFAEGKYIEEILK